jgi:hypothetical protein
MAKIKKVDSLKNQAKDKIGAAKTKRLKPVRQWQRVQPLLLVEPLLVELLMESALQLML